jgi:FkbM family methyltransferase
MKDITEYIRSGNTDFGTMNYLPLERLILKLPKNENLVVSEKNIKNLPFIHCKENIRQKPTVEIYVQEIFWLESYSHKTQFSTPKEQKNWLDFVLELSEKKIYKIFKNGEEVFKYQLFWSGINIDPNFSTIENFDKERNRDINLNIGISLSEGKEVFYELNFKSLSTFSINDAIKSTSIYKGAKIIKTYEVCCKKLSTILNEFKMNVDFLSIDVEGFELQVLHSNDWRKHRPELIIIEINRNTSEIFNYMKSIDYKLIYNNHTNGIFLDQNKMKYFI